MDQLKQDKAPAYWCNESNPIPVKELASECPATKTKAAPPKAMIEPMSFREENFSCFKKIANTVVK